MITRTDASTAPRLRRLVLVTTAPRERLAAALDAAGLAADTWDDVTHLAGEIPVRAGVAAAVAAGDVSAVVAAVRARATTGSAGMLLGAAVASAGVGTGSGDAELVRAAAAAMVAGYGVADDTDEGERRHAHATGSGTGLSAALRRRVRPRYLAMSRTRQRVALGAATFGLGWGLPFAAYTLLWVCFRVDVAPVLFWTVFTALALTALSIYAEALRALEPDRLPDPGQDGYAASDPLTTGLWPTVSLVVAAYLPNEADVLPDSVEALLAHDYPGPLEVLVAANGTGPNADRALAWLRARATTDDRLRVVLAPSSRSKAENVNAAMHAARAVIDGGIVGVLDADHQLAPGACARAARWITGGYADVVQGHNVVRNGADGWLQQIVAVEFEAIYALAHPGRAGLHGFGIFGGSNGFWRADLLDRLRMRPWLLTEDIDVSMRALLAGARIASDPRVVSRELAPETKDALWGQRTRWAQGWHQVSRLQLRPILRSPILSPRQKLGAAFLLGWREVYPWVSMQMFPIVGYQLVVRHTAHIHWLLPFFVFSALATTAVGPVQALAAWRLSVPEIRRQTAWFGRYLFLQGAVFGEIKSLVNRCAHLREWIGDAGWVVTPRHGLADTVSDATEAHEVVLPVVIGCARDGVVRSLPLARHGARRTLGDTSAGVTNALTILRSLGPGRPAATPTATLQTSALRKASS